MTAGSRVATVEPITFEILRHRIETINHEQARLAARRSGLLAESQLNTAILTPEGEGLFVGPHATVLAAALDLVVQQIIEQFGSGIRPGDLFLTNDPWSGALQQSAWTVAQPVFADGRLICWLTLASLPEQASSPEPGGIALRATETYAEGTIIPPVRIGEGGQLRPDLEAMATRNSRTSERDAQWLRAVLAAQTVARRRILEVASRYGVDTLLAAQQQIIEYARQQLRQRIAQLTDGTWRDQVYLERSGPQAELYALRLALTKREDRLVFDFRGTSPQAPGIINCTRSGLLGGLASVLFPLLGYDLPWSRAALMSCVEVIDDEGTVNNATHPAPVSLAARTAAWGTANLAAACVAKLLSASGSVRTALQAPSHPGGIGPVLSGQDRYGEPITTPLLGSGAGGAGAQAMRDGIDLGAHLTTLGSALPNVEENEWRLPILEVYRRLRPDSYGHGKYRGGAGLEYCIAPHKSAAPLTVTLALQGSLHPGAPGLYGGYPSSVQSSFLLHGADIEQHLAQGQLRLGVTALRAERSEPLAPQAHVQLGPGDAILGIIAGGAGYGDPLGRHPERVRGDVVRRICTAELAERIYGVVLRRNGEIDDAMTRARRALIRRERRDRSVPVDQERPIASANRLAQQAAALFAVGEHLEVVEAEERRWLRCAECGYVYGPAELDPKLSALVAERSIETASELNRSGATDRVLLREYCCPNCSTLIAVTLQQPDEPHLIETELT